MDAALFRWFNHLADRTSWAHGIMTTVTQYAIALFAVLLVIAWWSGRSADDPAPAVVAAVWAALASLVGVGLVQAIGGAVDRARPYVTMPGTHLLVDRTSDFSFPSDHGTASAAIAVGLVLACRYTNSKWVGWTAVALALIIGFSRVYVGAHYPGDVLAGFVLGGIVAWAGAPLAQRLLTPLARRLRTTKLGVLITAEPANSGLAASQS